MQKVLIGIFAHPDDEAMGPAATLIKQAEAGTAVYILCATHGEGGANPDNHPDVATLRSNEWQAACELMGVAGTHQLGYADGGLCNTLYQAASTATEQYVRAVCAQQTGPVELYLMSFDTNGLTGHLDHIFMSSVATQVFYRLAATPPAHTSVKELAYYCLSQQQQPQPNANYFVFMPAGRPPALINRRVDVSPFIQKKYDVMRAHHSQRSDADMWLSKGDAFYATDHFMVITP